MLFRFNGAVVSFNAPYFRCEVLAAVHRAGPDLKWFVLDMRPVTAIHATGFTVMTDVAEKLSARGVTVVVAGRQTEFQIWAEQRGLQAADETQRALHFSTLRQAMRAYKLKHTSHSRKDMKLENSHS